MSIQRTIFIKLMVKARNILVCLLACLSSISLFAQVVADFSMPQDGCIDQDLQILNLSENGQGFRWYFCSPSLMSENPTIVNSTNSLIARSQATAIANDTSVVIFYSSGSLRKASYSSTLLDATPILQAISGRSGSFSSQRDVTVVKENGTWIIFTANNSTSVGLSRSFLGNIIGSSLLSYDFIPGISPIYSTTSVAAINEGGQRILLAGKNSNGQIDIVNFANGFDQAPISSTNVVISGAGGIQAISSRRVTTGYELLIGTTTGDRIYSIQFDNNFSSSIVSPFVATVYSPTSPARISYVEDNGVEYLLIFNTTGVLDILQFASGNWSFLRSVDLSALALATFNVTHDSGNTILVGSTISGTYTGLNRILFDTPCSATPSVSTDYNPDVNYNLPGENLVTLVATNSSGDIDRKSHSLTIHPDIAPSASFSLTATQCASVPTSFTPTTTGLAYSWDFDGDGMEDSNEENPSFLFGSAGTYTVRLAVEDDTCGNFATQEITLYEEPPVPSFAISGNLCSSAELVFTNLTDDAAYAGPLTYEWDFDGDFTTDEESTTYQFGSAGQKTITLTARIPGCENTVQQVIELVSGPVAKFTAHPICAGELMTFTNQSTGATAYLWDFGDGYTSSQANPGHVYTAGGTYFATLTATDAQGCPSVYSLEVAVAHEPVAAFDFDIPCTGSQGISFFDQSAVLAADILTWAWYVDDVQVSTEQHPVLSFDAAATHQIRLDVMSSNGCYASVTESVTVLGSPVPAYTVTLGCQTQPSVFTDVTSGAGMVSRLWRINGQNYTTPTVNHVFSQSGTFDVSLTVTSADFCTSTTVGTVTVAPAPVLDFTMSSLCAGEEIVLTDTSIPGDPVVSRTWRLDGEAFFNGAQALLTDVPVGVHDVALEVRTASGCTFMHEKSLTFLASPVAEFTSSVAYGVPPFPVTFTNQSSGAVSYVWRINDVQVSTAPNFTQVINQEGNLPVELTVTSADGCTDTFSQSLLSAQPAIDLQVRDVVLIANGTTQNITVTLANEGNLPVEIFDVIVRAGSDVAVSERFNAYMGLGDEVTVDFASGLQLINANRICVSVQSAYADITPDDNEQCVAFTEQVLLEPPYPNPFDDEAVLRVILPETKDVRITITHISGKTMIDEQFTDLAAGLHVLRYASSQWEKGIYVVRMQAGGEVVVRKMLRF